MKPPALKLLLAVLLPCLLAASDGFRVFAQDPAPGFEQTTDTPPPLGTSPTPVAAATPAAAVSATPKPVKKPKTPKDPHATPRPPKIKKPKAIPFPLPINDQAKHIVIPEVGSTGTLLMNLMALQATRISNELVQLAETNIDVNHADGTEDFHISLPACVFNLETHIIASEQPVEVRTADFKLTGEKMEFNTVDRTGTLIGHVHMIIHNLKQVAGPQQTPAPE